MDSTQRVACIFYSVRTDNSEQQYEQWTREIDQEVRITPGYQSHASWRDHDSGRGVTISYFDDLASIEKWRGNSTHRSAQDLGHQTFYESYTVQIVNVLREYDWTAPTTPTK